MRVRVLHRFHDKADFMKVYLVDDTVTFDDSRAEYLISLGLVEEIKSEEKAVKPATTRRRSPQKEDE